MKAIAILAAAATLLTLAGCNRGMNANASANAATGNAAAPKPAASPGTDANAAAPQTADAGKLNAGGGAIPASSAGTVRLDRTYIMGRWTDDGNCDKATEFTQDGRFIGADGTSGLWNLDGEWLTLSDNRRTIRLRMQPIDQNTTDTVQEDGLRGHSTRC